MTVADVAPVRLWRSLALTRLQADPVAPLAAGADGAEPVVLVEPVVVLEEPVAVLEEPHAETIAMQARENAMAAQRRRNMSRSFQEEGNSQDLWMDLGTLSDAVSVSRCTKSVKPKVRDPPAVESGQPDGERVISASSPLAPRQFHTQAIGSALGSNSTQPPPDAGQPRPPRNGSHGDQP
jgi:hypothetical protein